MKITDEDQERLDTSEDEQGHRVDCGLEPPQADGVKRANPLVWTAKGWSSATVTQEGPAG
jgi:hypothetical protein